MCSEAFHFVKLEANQNTRSIDWDISARLRYNPQTRQNIMFDVIRLAQYMKDRYSRTQAEEPQAYRNYEFVFKVPANPPRSQRTAYGVWGEFKKIIGLPRRSRPLEGLTSGWHEVFVRTDAENRIYTDDMRGPSETRPGQRRVQPVPDKGNDPRFHNMIQAVANLIEWEDVDNGVFCIGLPVAYSRPQGIGQVFYVEDPTHRVEGGQVRHSITVRIRRSSHIFQSTNAKSPSSLRNSLQRPPTTLWATYRGCPLNTII